MSPTGELDFEFQNYTYWNTEKHSAEVPVRFLFSFLKDAMESLSLITTFSSLSSLSLKIRGKILESLAAEAATTI